MLTAQQLPSWLCLPQNPVDHCAYLALLLLLLRAEQQACRAVLLVNLASQSASVFSCAAFLVELGQT